MRKPAFFLSASCFIVLLIMGSEADFLIAKQLHKTTTPAIKRHSQMIDANQLAMTITNYGVFARNPVTGNADCYYPNGTDKTLIYAAGLWITGKVNGEIRTACSDYVAEYQPGIILPDGMADNPDREKYRVYKIKPGDSADPNDPNYNKDYAEWLIADGVPVDENGDPLILGDQTLWCVMNDLDQSLHNGAYSTRPLNIEVQLLAWAYDDDTTPLGKTIFLYYTIINKGTDPITDAYIGIFVDPDLGNANDDGSACDTTLNLTYDYNRKSADKVYGMAPPAVGICLLQGPVAPSMGEEAFQFLHPPILNAKLLNMTSNSVYY